MNSTTNATQQLGMAALKVAVDAKCQKEINSIPAWQIASKLLTNNQKQSIQTQVCRCVSEKAPSSVSASDLVTATFDTTARAAIVSQVVTKTAVACVNETFNKMN